MVERRDSDVLGDLRRAFWHLRNGGASQVREFVRRRRNSRRTASAQATETHVAPIGARGAYAIEQGHRVLDFEPHRAPKRGPRLPDITAAVILDDFSLLAWGYEFTTVEITPDNWRETFSQRDIDFLFVESAWAGNHTAWQYHLTGPTAPRPAVVELLEYCRTHGIPSVFWNKEDPPHYADFLDTARLFDIAFTSDVNKVDDYRRDLGHDRVAPLSFAAQPAIHNPIRPQHGHQERDVAFAGMYFAHKYPERRDQMELVLGGALDVSPRMGKGLEIFSRFLGDDPKYQFPEPFGDRVAGSLPYEKMLTAYKAYKVFLNVNSVVDSPSMCARRIFEITASGTPVVTTPSAAVPRFFTSDQVPQVFSRDDAAHTVRALVRSPELRDRMTHVAQRTIWDHHTYSHRTADVLRAIGVSARGAALELPTVSAVVSTNRPHQLRHVIDTAAGQVGVRVQLVVVAHGFPVDHERLQREARDAGVEDLRVLGAPSDWLLGRCLREGFAAADGEVLSKMDDDDLYGPNYLADLLRALRYSNADVVGKQAHFMYLHSVVTTLLRFPEREHRWTDFVMGPTITGRREIFTEVPFGDLQRGEDTDLLRRVSEAGGSIYSADRFNFQQTRTLDSGAHTWNASDRELLATGTVQYFGSNPTQICI